MTDYHFVTSYYKAEGKRGQQSFWTFILKPFTDSVHRQVVFLIKLGEYAAYFI